MDETKPVRSRSSVRRIAWLGLLILFISGISSGLWFGFLRDRLIAKRWGTVVPGVVYRSGQVSQYLIGPTLEKHHIKHVICMTSPDARDPDQQAELESAKAMGIELRFFPLNGRGVGKVEHFTGAVTHLARNAQRGEPVLVHCHAGTQRTGGIVAAYRLLVERQSPDFVMAELKRYGWNPSRDAVLLEFVNSNLQSTAEQLVAAGCIKDVPHPLPVLR